MKKELEHKIVSTHPLLYRDRYADKMTTCMCWGLSVGDGWYQILWDLSQKLEPMIQEYVDENPNLKCYNCSCEVLDHSTDMEKCNSIHHLPYSLGPKWGGGYYVPQWKRDFWKSLKPGEYPSFKYFWKTQVWSWVKGKCRRLYAYPNRILRWLYNKYNIGYDKPCHCRGFKLNHPCASQVKEKFGDLRFYMTSATEEMWTLIHEAEKLAGETCEACGKPGEQRGGGWVLTLCDDCNDAREADRSKPAWKILEERSPYYEEESNSSKS